MCKSKRRCSGQDPAYFPPRQTMRRWETRGTRQEVSTSSSPARGWCCISSPEQSLPVVFGNYLCPDFQNWEHVIAHVFAHVITVIVTTAVVMVQASNQLHIQTGRGHFLHRAPNIIYSYTLLAEHLQQDLLSQCSPVQHHSILLWQRNKLYNLIRHFPSVTQNGAFWRQRCR